MGTRLGAVRGGNHIDEYTNILVHNMRHVSSLGVGDFNAP